MSENKAAEAPRKTKIASFRIGKGVKKPAGPAFTMISEYVEVEVKLPEGATENDFQAEFSAAEYIIDNLLQAPQVAAPTEAAASAKPVAPQVKITMTPAEIDAMPWQASKWIRKNDTNRLAQSGEDAWIFEDKVDARLVQMLNEAGKAKLEIPPYSFQRKELGETGAKIITRKTMKTKE